MEIISSIKDIIALITGAATVVIAILVYRNTQKGTPPELLNLEKWESIKSSISKNKHSYTLEDRQKVNNNFTIALYQANKSIRIDELEIESQSTKNDLKNIPVNWKYQIFPPHPQNAMSISDLIIWYTILIFSLLVTIISVCMTIFYPTTGIPKNLDDWPIKIFFVIFSILSFILTVFCLKAKDPYSTVLGNTMKKKIITRNVFRAYFDIFSVDSSLGNTIRENRKQAEQRAKFESKRFFKKWIQNDGEGKSSWDYGFTAETGVDNADNFDSHEPDKLAPQGYIFTPNWDSYLKNVENWYMKNRFIRFLIFFKRPKRKLKKK